MSAALLLVESASEVVRGLTPTGPHQTAIMLGAMCMILGNAAGTSWELIVQVARQRRTAQHAP